MSLLFLSQLINTIYDNIHQVNISEALDYLNKNDKGKFTHSYIENEGMGPEVRGPQGQKHAL